MFIEREGLVLQQRQRDMMAAADKVRLIDLARQANGSPRDTYRRWLAQLGAWLVDQGQKLQTRYAQPSIRHPIASK